MSYIVVPALHVPKYSNRDGKINNPAALKEREFMITIAEKNDDMMRYESL